MKSSKKILIIVIIMIVVLAIAGTTLGFLYLKTDLFKSDKELFQKYVMQDIEKIGEIAKSNIYQTYEDTKNQSIYESNTDIDISYSEGGEISSPFNDLSFSFKEQKENEYSYRNAKILYQDETYLEIEGIRNQELYGVRLPEVKQFVSVKNVNELQNIQNLEINKETIQNIAEIIDNDNLLIDKVFTQEEMDTLIDTCFTILKSNIENASFSSQKNVMITVDNNTIKANAYIATLQPNQVQEIITQILTEIRNNELILNKIEEIGLSEEGFYTYIDNYLENLGIDEQLPVVNIAVYVQNKATIQTLIEYGVKKVIIRNLNNDNVQKLNIQRTVLNNEQEEQQNIEISKTKTESGENYDIVASIIKGTEQYDIESSFQIENNNNIIETQFNTNYIKGITNIQVSLINTIDTTQITERVELNETNNIVLSDYDEETQQNVINNLKNNVPNLVNTKLQELIDKLGIRKILEQLILPNSNEDLEYNQENTTQEPSEDTEENQMSQIEINRFNAKFEFYTGNEVSADNVKNLLEIIKNNLNKVETSENGEIKLYIEKDAENAEQLAPVIESIIENEKYKVAITYKESNGIIDYITINKIVKESN